MFANIVTIALAVFIAPAANGAVWNGFVASWSSNSSTNFYRLPKTLEAAENEGWTGVSGVNEPEGVVPLGFDGDPTFVLLFAEENGAVIGYEMAIPVSGLHPQQPLKWAELDLVITKTLNGDEYYTITIYFHEDEETATRKLYFQEKTQLTEIPTIESEIPSKLQLKKENCIKTMGSHYHAWNPSTDCSTLYPLLLLSEDGVVTGTSLQAFGNLPTIGARTWWEVVPDNALAAVREPPTCASENVKTYGTISLHVWFKDSPETIACD